jgi:ribosomal protein L37AE/L43A
MGYKIPQRRGEVGQGAATRFDMFSGSRIDSERKKAEATGVFLNFGKRFCEHCNSYKPKGKRKAVKGWKCDDCMTANLNSTTPPVRE